MDKLVLIIILIVLWLIFTKPKEEYRRLDPPYVRTNGPSDDNVYYCQSLCADARRGVEWWWQNQDRGFGDCFMQCMNNPK